ncbi:MAG: hypothetical protein AB2A00_41545 [Myxococcota bacterium]
MSRRPLTTVMVAVTCLVAGLFTARCERPPTTALVPMLDVCCWCLATSTTPRGARCSRGSVTDCIHDFEHIVTPDGPSINISESNPKCLRDICAQQCWPLGTLLPARADILKCCECVANGKQQGVDCYAGTAEECADEIDEGEVNGLLQGGFQCMTGEPCQKECEALVGAPPDAGTPDAAPPPVDAGFDDAGNVIIPPDAGPGPTLPWDGGCPLRWGCF